MPVPTGRCIFAPSCRHPGQGKPARLQAACPKSGPESGCCPGQPKLQQLSNCYIPILGLSLSQVALCLPAAAPLSTGGCLGGSFRDFLQGQGKARPLGAPQIENSHQNGSPTPRSQILRPQCRCVDTDTILGSLTSPQPHAVAQRGRHQGMSCSTQAEGPGLMSVLHTPGPPGHPKGWT